MAIDFPNTPTTNQIYTVGSRSWKWDGTIWAIYSNNPVLYRQDSPPSSPQEGDQWFETDTGRMFVYYGTAWVELGNATDVAGALQPSQVTALSAVTTLTSDDVFPVVDGPSGAVASSKITWGNVQSSITSTGTLGSLAVTGDITRGGVSMPRGIMAYATRETTGLTTTLGDIGLSVTFTAVANRLYKYTFYCYASNSTASGVLGTFVTDSSNVIKEALNLYVVAGGNYTFQHLTYISTETAGTVTRKIRANTQFGSGTLFGPLYFFVEDIGAA